MSLTSSTSLRALDFAGGTVVHVSWPAVIGLLVFLTVLAVAAGMKSRNRK